MEPLAQTLEPQTLVEFKTVDGMFIRGIHLPRAGMYPQHSHEWDHSTLLARGSIALWKGREVSYHKAPAILFIEKKVQHKFQTLEDDTLLYCLHNLHFGEAPEVLAQHELLLD